MCASNSLARGPASNEHTWPVADEDTQVTMNTQTIFETEGRLGTRAPKMCASIPLARGQANNGHTWPVADEET